MKNVIPKINLTEVFETTTEVIWKQTGNEHIGYFILDNNTYAIHLDEYILTLPSGKQNLIDIGFSIEKISGIKIKSSQKATNLNVNASKILGIVMNELRKKISITQYDIIVLGAHNKNQNVKSRMQIYSFMAKKYAKPEGLDIIRLSGPTGEYILLAKNSLSPQDVDIIQQHINK